jgi:hypothetical protein
MLSVESALRCETHSLFSAADSLQTTHNLHGNAPRLRLMISQIRHSPMSKTLPISLQAVNVRVGYDLNRGHLTAVHRFELVAAQPWPREAACDERTAK